MSLPPKFSMASHRYLATRLIFSFHHKLLSAITLHALPLNDFTGSGSVIRLARMNVDSELQKFISPPETYYQHYISNIITSCACAGGLFYFVYWPTFVFIIAEHFA